MTKTTRDKIVTAVLGGLVSAIVALVIFAFTARYDREQSLKEKVQQIDKTKAEITYVDKKCDEIKQASTDQYNQLRDDIKQIDQNQNRLMELLIENK
jgi:gas vesicle protein